MLETTLATDFTPGTNLKGDLAGGNWTFLLPSLALEQTVCIGTPPPATLVTLARISRDILVYASVRQLQHVSTIRAEHGLAHIRLSIADGGPAPQLPDHSADLVVVTGGRSVWRLTRDRTTLVQLQRLLKPEGLIYFEGGWLVGWLLSSKKRNNLIENFGTPLLFWLASQRGEVHAAVPLHDRPTIGYFLRRNLHRPSAGFQLLKRARHLLGKTGRSPAHSSLPAGRATGGSPDSAPPSPHPIVRSSGGGLLRAVRRAERLLRAEHPLNRVAPRYGGLVGAGAELSDRPPAYLRAIAREGGVDIDEHRWGLSAPSEYRSRKVLFFLFDRVSEVPGYIVKLTRDPSLNYRVENEYRALSLLCARGIGDRETLPQPLFFGYHNDLAVVGETAIEGAPFRQRTEATADCPYAHAAIDWLTGLGAGTADRVVGTPRQVADALETLFNRFTQVYRLTPAHRDFLAEQITVIGDSREALPLVFQHGDPGTWNVMVTKRGRVAFLDWEAAEPQGIPLWDLFYFLRSYSVWVARTSGTRDRLDGFARYFLAESALSSVIVVATERYCQQVALPWRLVEPLFYTCWMHRALKESTRLAPAKLETGHYLNLLRLCIERRSAPTLRRLFSRSPVNEQPIGCETTAFL